MPRIYFARAIDDQSEADIYSLSDAVSEELSRHGLEVIDPIQELRKNYRQESNTNLSQTELTELLTQYIVNSELNLLKAADAVLMDCTLPDRQYVGTIGELIYAHMWNIPVVAYVGTSNIGERLWFKYHATHICQSRAEAIQYLVALFSHEKPRVKRPLQ
jgi:nucleoside 2-deoxyribosyltransferase